MLPDQPVELSPGVTVRSFSVEHLRHESLLRHLSLPQLADELASTGAGVTTWPFTDFFCTVGIMFAERLGIPLTSQILLDALGRRKPSPVDANSDREIIEIMIREGDHFALGAYWGVAEQYWLLWAAAAAFLEHLGCQHPNDIP